GAVEDVAAGIPELERLEAVRARDALVPRRAARHALEVGDVEERIVDAALPPPRQVGLRAAPQAVRSLRLAQAGVEIRRRDREGLAAVEDRGPRELPAAGQGLGQASGAGHEAVPAPDGQLPGEGGRESVTPVEVRTRPLALEVPGILGPRDAAVGIAAE